MNIFRCMSLSVSDTIRLSSGVKTTDKSLSQILLTTCVGSKVTNILLTTCVGSKVTHILLTTCVGSKVTHILLTTCVGFNVKTVLLTTVVRSNVTHLINNIRRIKGNKYLVKNMHDV